MTDATFIALVIALCLLLGGGTYWSVRREERQRTEKLAREEEYRQQRNAELVRLTSVPIEHHADRLAIVLRQAIYTDQYGERQYDRWYAETKYFFTKYIIPVLPTDMTQAEKASLLSSCEAVFLEITEGDSIVPQGQTSTPTDGIGYERMIAKLLSDAGAEVTFTAATGDQGIDLVATFAGRRHAIQCKNYSSPVGNSAVQEAYSGAAFYAAPAAVVVAPNGFTRAARQLAHSLKVDCLHHDEIAAFVCSPAAEAGLQPS